MPEPSANGSNGRNPATGRFAVGNPGGPGNPHAGRVAAIRGVLLDAVGDDDIRAVVAKLVEMARGGDLLAIRELFDRTLGKAPAAVTVVDPGADVTRIVIVEDPNWCGNDAHARFAATMTDEQLESIAAGGTARPACTAGETPTPLPGAKGKL